MDQQEFDRLYRMSRHPGVYTDFLSELAKGKPALFSTYNNKQSAVTVRKGLQNTARKGGLPVRVIVVEGPTGFEVHASRT